MQCRWCLCSALLALLPAVQAAARPPAPVCRVSSVVDVMRQTLQAHWYYERLDPARVMETPGPDGRTVRCDVCVPVTGYDMIHFGNRPLMRCDRHAFNVMATQNGFVVQYLQ